MRTSRRVVVVASCAALAVTGFTVATVTPGSAAPPDILHASVSKDLTCTSRPYPNSNAVDERSFTSTVDGIVQARLIGNGDWDLAVFDTDTGKVVAGSAGYRTDELAEGFVTQGQHLLVQGCRFRGQADTARLTIEFFAEAQAKTEREQIVRVNTPTRADKTRLQSLDLDLTESGTATTLDVMLHGSADAAKLRKAKFTYRVTVPDVAAQSRKERAADEEFAATTKKSDLPSGRTTYRRLFDYELEMKRLTIAYPDLVRALTLPYRTIEGRNVEGIEITENAQQLHDGKPVFLNMGVHHAREWPAGESAMEFAYDLLQKYQAGGGWAKRIAATRTIIIPIVNPDGFNISREAPLLGDFSRFDYENKRKTCRASDSPAQYRGGTCGANPGGAYRGTDPNRNYAGFWGGSGASSYWADETYRGSKPFSEPETRNIRRLISSRQVVTLVSNHTFSGLVLRPPGVYDTRPPLDEPTYKALGDSLAAHNGYASVPSYDLYDTTGTTEDWSYWNTGGFGFTFEIGITDFHPAFRLGVVDEYLGLPPVLGAGHGGNQAAYYTLLAATADSSMHSTLRGIAPAGMVLRVHKTFTTPTSPVIRADGSTGDPIVYPDTLDTTYTAPGGRFRFSVNPSTRPYVAGRLGRDPLAPPQDDQSLANPDGVPAENQGDPFSGPHETIPFTIKGLPDVDNGTAEVKISWDSPTTDWDVYVLDSRNNLVGVSANGGTTSEDARLIDPPAGRYRAIIVNYENGATDDWGDGIVDYKNPLPTTYGPPETWTLTCETRDGVVKGSQEVFVARGQVVDLGPVCTPAATK